MYINFIISVGRSSAEGISDELLREGALSVSRERNGGKIRLSALFDESHSDRLSEEYAEFDPSVEAVEDRDWQNEWIKHYEPVIVDGVCAIIPAGTDCESALPKIIIDPHDAFGSGTHPTTVLCLRYLHDIIRRIGTNRGGIRLLDIGTGSGILAIFAALQGIDRAEGCDIEEKAVIRAGENAARNGVESAVDFFVSSIEELPVSAPYDIVCANLQSAIIENNIDAIIRLVKKEGVIIASGIGSQWKGEIERLFGDHDLEIELRGESSGWMGYLLRA